MLRKVYDHVRHQRAVVHLLNSPKRLSGVRTWYLATQGSAKQHGCTTGDSECPSTVLHRPTFREGVYSGSAGMLPPR